MERKHFKLSFSSKDIKFTINEKKKVVTCLVAGTVLTAFNFNSLLSIPYKQVRGFGKATCHADDEFDVERGKRIAMAKAENNAYRLANNYLKNYAKELKFYLNGIEEFEDKAMRTCHHNTLYMEGVSNPDNPKYKKKLAPINFG